MLRIIYAVFWIILFGICGFSSAKFAIQSYRDEDYFLFVADVMITVFNIALLIALIVGLCI